MKIKCIIPIIVLGLAFIAGISMLTGGLDWCKRKIDIVPGLTWKYYSDKYSRLVMEGHGIVAEGQVRILICDYGLFVISPNERHPTYIDLLEWRVTDITNTGTNLWNNVDALFSTDAASAMGIYDAAGKQLFGQALIDLKMRIRRRHEAQGPAESVPLRSRTQKFLGN